MINLSLVKQRKCKEGEIKMIELRKITGKNIEEVIALEVGENQKTFFRNYEPQKLCRRSYVEHGRDTSDSRLPFMSMKLLLDL